MKKLEPKMSDKLKDECKQCLLELLAQNMPVIDDTPLEFRLSIASIIGGLGASLGNAKDGNFIRNAAVIMAYLSQATDDEILVVIRESKAGAN